MIRALANHSKCFDQCFMILNANSALYAESCCVHLTATLPMFLGIQGVRLPGGFCTAEQWIAMDVPCMTHSLGVGKTRRHLFLSRTFAKTLRTAP